jgi:transposase
MERDLGYKQLAYKEENKRPRIWEMLTHQETDKAIRTQLHVSGKVVTEVRHAFKSGLACPEPKRRGRPSKMTPEVVKAIHEQTVADPWLSSEGVAQKIGTEEDPISRRTIDTVRGFLQFKFKRLRPAPLLKDTHKERRVQFCNAAIQARAQLDWTKSVVISDESRFALFSDSRRAWVQTGYPSPKTFLGQPKKAAGKMVWGAIGKGYKSELIGFAINSTVDAGTYQRMFLVKHIFTDMREKFAATGRPMPHFQQDGAKPHVAKTTMAFFREHHINVIPNWPANSPDLSPIENLWGVLKRRVAIREPQNIDQVWNCLKDEWNKLDQRMIDRLIDGTYRRFQLCVDMHGESIGHLLNRRKRPGDRENPLTPSTIRDVHIGKELAFWGRNVGFTPSSSTPDKLDITMEDPHPRAGRVPCSITVIAPVEIRALLEPNEEYYMDGVVEGGRMRQGQPKKTSKSGFQFRLQFVRFVDPPRKNEEEEEEVAEDNPDDEEIVEEEENEGNEEEEATS